MDNSPEAFQAQAAMLINLASILGGFTFATFVSLMLVSDERRRVSVTAIVFALASCVFLFALVSFTFMSGLATEAAAVPRLIPIAANMTLIEVGGILLLLLGIGLAGWLRSSKMGIVTTVTASVTAVVIIVAIVWVLLASDAFI